MIDSNLHGNSQTGQALLRLEYVIPDASYPLPPVVKMKIDLPSSKPSEIKLALPITILSLTKILPQDPHQADTFRSTHTPIPSASIVALSSLSWKSLSTVCVNP